EIGTRARERRAVVQVVTQSDEPRRIWAELRIQVRGDLVCRTHVIPQAKVTHLEIVGAFAYLEQTKGGPRRYRGEVARVDQDDIDIDLLNLCRQRIRHREALPRIGIKRGRHFSGVVRNLE